MFREVARKKQSLEMSQIIKILNSEKRGVLSVQGDNGYPYGMPMNHFYNEEDGKIYFHCGAFGHRLDALKKHDKVSFCVFDQGYRNEGECCKKPVRHSTAFDCNLFQQIHYRLSDP